MQTFDIRRLLPSDALAYRTIRLEALETDPDAFSSTYAAEIQRPLSDFAERLQTSAVFAAFLGDRIVGMAGLAVESGAVRRHRGYVWGVFVARDCRRRGIAEALLRSVIHHARGSIQLLAIGAVEDNASALRLYARLGFKVWGVEPRALCMNGQYRDETHLSLWLGDGGHSGPSACSASDRRS